MRKSLEARRSSAEFFSPPLTVEFLASEKKERELIEFLELIPDSIFKHKDFIRFNVDLSGLRMTLQRCQTFLRGKGNAVDYYAIWPLFALSGNESALDEFLIQEERLPLLNDDLKRSLLFCLVLSNHDQLLLKWIAIFSDFAQDYIESLIFLGAYVGSEKVVVSLIKQFNFSVKLMRCEDSSTEGTCILHGTIPGGHTQLFWQLVNDFGADIKIGIFMTVYAAECEQWDLVCELEERGLIAPVAQYPQMLIYAAKSNLARFKQYVEELKDFDFAHFEFEGENLYYAALKGGRKENVEYVLEQGWFKPDATFKFGEGALHVAVSFGHDELFEHLFEKYQLDRELRDEDGEVILHYAARYGNWRKFNSYMINHTKHPYYFDEQIMVKNQFGHEPVHSAALSGHLILVQKLTDRPSSFQRDTGEKLRKCAESSENEVLLCWVDEQIARHKLPECAPLVLEDDAEHHSPVLYEHEEEAGDSVSYNF